jgi:hypothetical protein
MTAVYLIRAARRKLKGRRRRRPRGLFARHNKALRMQEGSGGYGSLRCVNWLSFEARLKRAQGSVVFLTASLAMSRQRYRLSSSSSSSSSSGGGGGSLQADVMDGMCVYGVPLRFPNTYAVHSVKLVRYP